MIPSAVNALLYIINREEKPKIALSPWDFVTLPEEDRAMATGNIHKKFGKDYAPASGDMLVEDRQTDVDVLITILCHRFHERSNQKYTCSTGETGTQVI